MSIVHLLVRFGFPSYLSIAVASSIVKLKINSFILAHMQFAFLSIFEKWKRATFVVFLKHPKLSSLCWLGFIALLDVCRQFSISTTVTGTNAFVLIARERDMWCNFCWKRCTEMTDKDEEWIFVAKFSMLWCGSGLNFVVCCYYCQ